MRAGRARGARGRRHGAGARAPRVPPRLRRARVRRRAGSLGRARCRRARAPTRRLPDRRATLALQDAQIATATAELATARARLEGARRLVVETTERESELRATSEDGVVDAYIGAAGERTARIWLQAADVNEVACREQLLDVVNGNLDAHLDQLRLVAEARRGAEHTPRPQPRTPPGSRPSWKAAQAELAERRDAQGRLEDALRGSIGDWQAKADELDRSEQQLTEVIRAHQASQDAAAAAAAAPGGLQRRQRRPERRWGRGRRRRRGRWPQPGHGVGGRVRVPRGRRDRVRLRLSPPPDTGHAAPPRRHRHRRPRRLRRLGRQGRRGHPGRGGTAATATA